MITADNASTIPALVDIINEKLLPKAVMSAETRRLDEAVPQLRPKRIKTWICCFKRSSPSWRDLLIVVWRHEAAEAVAVNVVETVSRPMITKSMLSEMVMTYTADKNTRKDFENPEDGRFE
jgi:hypothetical protein